MLLITDPWFYAAAVPAVICVGLSKGGFGGTFAMLGVPIMSLVISPLQAAGIMLPILLVMDAVALMAYKGKADWRSLAILLPAAMLGIGIGWGTAAYVNDTFVTLMIGVISLAFVADYVFKRSKETAALRPQCTERIFLGSGRWLYKLHQPHGRPAVPDVYAAPETGTDVVRRDSGDLLCHGERGKGHALFFLGQFDSTNLTTSVTLFPVALIATLAGVRLVRIVKAETFYGIIYVFMAVIGVKLTYDGIYAFFA
jgi:uncharacterized membrane protein YfcA